MAIAQDGRVCVCVCGSTKAQEKLQIQKNVISALPSPFYKKNHLFTLAFARPAQFWPKLTCLLF